MRSDPRYIEFRIMGLALELLESHIGEIKSKLGSLHDGNGTPLVEMTQPAKQIAGAKRVHSYWASMTAEERSGEMKRRQRIAAKKRGETPGEYQRAITQARLNARWPKGDAVAVGTEKIKAGVKLHPRDPAHPDHEAWLKKMRRVNREHWKALTPAQHKARVDAMIRGRRDAAK